MDASGDVQKKLNDLKFRQAQEALEAQLRRELNKEEMEYFRIGFYTGMICALKDETKELKAKIKEAQ